jgi:hypothetical protein
MVAIRRPTKDLPPSDPVPYEEVLGWFPGRKEKNGANWHVVCPAHPDKNPSLHITPRDSAPPLFHCFGNECGLEDILDAIGKKTADLYRRRPSPSPRASAEGKVVAVYPYEDDAGELVYEVLRYEPKRFKQRRPDGHGGYAWNLDGVERVVFRHPQVVAAKRSRRLLWCEGEKDVITAEGLGFLATTTSGGSNGLGTYAPGYLRSVADGRHVAIVRDPDAPGLKYATTLARIIAPVAKRVKIVSLPGNLDLADWKATKNGTKADLIGIVDETPPWVADEETTEEEEAPESSGAVAVVQWMRDVEKRPIDWLWTRWLAKGKLHILGGVGGIGKGTLTTELAAQLSTGSGTLPDGTAAPFVKTLFLLSEDAPDDTLKPRLEVHGADMDAVAHLPAIRGADGGERMPSLSEHIPLLEAVVKEHGFGLVVIDALSDFMPGSDRNSEGEVRDILTPLAGMARRTGVAILGVMHPGKGNGDLKAFQRLLGASAFGNVARCVWLAAESPDGEGRNLLGVDKSNLAIKPKALEWSRAEDAPIAWHGESEHAIGDVFGSSSAKPRDDAEGFLNELLRGGSVPSERVFALAKAAGHSERTIRRAADHLKVVRYRPPGQRNPPWYWKLPNGAPSDDPPDDDPPATVKPHVSHNSGDDEWYTPPATIAAARAVLGEIDLDPASSAEANEVVRAARFYTVEDDGLKQPWAGRLWMNPPYKQPAMQHFCTRLAHEYTVGAVTEAVVLVNNATETRWFGELAAKSSALCLLSRRVKFWRPDKDSKGPLQGQVVLYLGRNVPAFRAAFGQFGQVTVPTHTDELATPRDSQVANSSSRQSELRLDHDADCWPTPEKPQNGGEVATDTGGGHLAGDDADGLADDGRLDELANRETQGVANSSNGTASDPVFEAKVTALVEMDPADFLREGERLAWFNQQEPKVEGLDLDLRAYAEAKAMRDELTAGAA